MAEITLKYDESNSKAQNLIQRLLSTGLFKKADNNCGCYTSEFVTKVRKSEKEIKQGKTTKVNTADLWNSF